jgi:hypothetical protein
MRTFVRPLLSTLLALAGCATPPPPSDTAGWQPVALPGKRSTSYDWTTKEGRPALRARADQSASLLRRTLTIDPDALGDVRFSWWVDAPLPGADLAAAGLGDSPARILFAFDGNHSTLSARNRLLFDLAESVGGERARLHPPPPAAGRGRHAHGGLHRLHAVPVRGRPGDQPAGPGRHAGAARRSCARTSAWTSPSRCSSRASSAMPCRASSDSACARAARCRR